jgi:hypothetical protein
LVTSAWATTFAASWLSSAQPARSPFKLPQSPSS